ncbi:glycosyltransferase [Streptomyces sp. TRM66268-LWL]|uniref:Glycosyltransferase n=1 Tax=Streptomyces polyasparticus TaxID=2767826 RepID=A0ABR7SY11_9ACTN|nr:glycosyltransferase [Streptomyces polyasparticus]MBC9719532.1 glycosyltransferase [Streptomyces polyasparticus]
MNSPGRLAVVIPYGGGFGHLRDQLAALDRQTWTEPFEVIISWNRGTEDPGLRLAGEAYSTRMRVMVVNATGAPGPSYARNVGWRSTDAELILFCDADDVADPGWMKAMAEGLSQSAIVCGVLSYGLLNEEWLASLFSTGRTELPVRFRHLPYAPSCNLGLSRDLLIRLDGFDESLLCGEDADLCWRAAYEGALLVCAREARMEYRLRSTPRALFRQSFQYSRYDIPLYRRHRDRGARWTPADIGRDLLAAAKAVTLVPLGRSHRARAMMRCGAVLGMLRGSLSRHS